MPDDSGLQRFLDAQQTDYAVALSEIKRGRKASHWMWYVFPQIRGLGTSETSRYYAIKDIREAGSFLKHPVLGTRLIEICQALLDLQVNDANRIFGRPDDLKLRSSMSLFALIPDAHPIFQKILDRFFKGARDSRTAEILKMQ